MSNFTPLATRVEQLATKINQIKNTPLARLQSHSAWQTHHISSIEEYNHNLKNRVQELETQNSHLEQRIHEMSNQHDNLTYNNTSQPSSLVPTDYTQYPLAVLNTENKVLDQIHENTVFLQNLVQQQQKDLQERNIKINTMQRSVSWQVTGPLRVTGKLANNITTASSQAYKVVAKPINKAHSYINQRPKLKNNLLKIIGIKKLYSSK